MQLSYRFTGLESKHFCWNFASLIQELLKINSVPKRSVGKLHSLAITALKLRDAVSIFSRVEISREQLNSLKVACHHFFNSCLLLPVMSLQLHELLELQSPTTQESCWRSLAMDWV